MHDLDLSVRAAGLGGVTLLGNGGSVADPSQPDRENNVEQVALDGLPGGQVAIQVGGWVDGWVGGSAGPGGPVLACVS